MAYGIHWEWRGFGVLPAHARSGIERLPAQFSAPDTVIDEYLWVPGLDINLKLRSRGAGTLKFKRLLKCDSATGLELWEERADEEFAFPLASEAVARLQAALGIVLKLPPHPITKDELVNALQQVQRSVTVVRVTKVRRARILVVPEGTLLVEIADISSPEATSSVGIEDDFRLANSTDGQKIEVARAAVTRAVESLGLRVLTTCNYLDASARWSTGGRVAA